MLAERMLAFGSSSLLKLLREYQVVPGKAVEELSLPTGTLPEIQP